MGDTNKRYTKEFKVSAVKLVTEQGLTASKAANDLGVSKSAISTWVRRPSSIFWISLIDYEARQCHL